MVPSVMAPAVVAIREALGDVAFRLLGRHFPLRRPRVPCFVVITITPFAASVPYSVDADGPFRISIDLDVTEINVVEPGRRGVSRLAD